MPIEQALEGKNKLEQMEGRHNAWLDKARDGAFKGAMFALAKTKEWGGLVALIGSASEAFKGDWQKALAYLGALLVLHGAGKGLWAASKKFGTPKLQGEMAEAEDTMRQRELEKLYGKDPGRLKGILENARSMVMRKEGKDYETEDDRKRATARGPEELEKFEDTQRYRLNNDIMEKYRKDPQGVRDVLRWVADSIQHDEKRERA